MEALIQEYDRIERLDSLDKSLKEVQDIIESLREAKTRVEAESQTADVTLAKLQVPVSSGFSKINDNLKEIYSGHNRYAKALEKKFSQKPLTIAESDPFAERKGLVEGAIATHMLREGYFDVAATYRSESNVTPPQTPWPIRQNGQPGKSPDNTHGLHPESYLQHHFSEMYRILDAMRNGGNLSPAIDWARRNSNVLEARGSNLEYELCRLQFISHFQAGGPKQGRLAAINYAKATFPRFPTRYSAQIHALLGALAFAPDMDSSPYAELFSNSVRGNDLCAAAAAAFTAEFCALLSLSSASPLLTAVTAGCIALPSMQKLSQIRQHTRFSWTTASELPVEIPLPPQYQFHSVFVCPVSKEQSTDDNPPMLMPCGHVICKDSLTKIAKGNSFKCPYCPAESSPDKAVRVYL